MNKVLCVALAIVFLSLTGCATILTDKTTKVNVTTSNGKAATVNIKGTNYQVPGIINIPKSKDDLVLKTSGECEGQAFSASKIEPTFWINIISGGAFGSTTDLASDKMWKYDDNMDIKCK